MSADHGSRSRPNPTAMLATVVSGFTHRRVLMIVALTAAWCVLWGSLSPANVLSGAVVSLLVTAPGLGGSISGGVRLIPLLQLVWLIFVDLVKSTLYVSREIMTPHDNSSESITAVTVAPGARRHMLLYTAAITLTPGTVVVDTDEGAGVLYVHLLHDDGLEANHVHVQRMADLVSRAFPFESSGHGVSDHEGSGQGAGGR